MEDTVNSLAAEQAANAWLAGEGTQEDALILARFAKQTFARTRSILDLTTIEEGGIEDGTDQLCMIRHQIDLRKKTVKYVSGQECGEFGIVEVSNKG